MPPPPLNRHADCLSFMRGVVSDVSTALRATIKRTGSAILAVPGGRTISAIIPVLAAQPLPWDRIVVTLVDERWVPPTHPDSNEGAVRSLFARTSPKVSIQGLFSPDLTAEQASVALAGRVPGPDVILLAMADDGHIGSLFPKNPANHAHGLYSVVYRPDHVRITMTPTVLNAAQNIILAIDSAAKAALLDTALGDGPPGDLPVRHALRAGARVHICAL